MSNNPGFISGQTSLFFDEDGNIKYEDDDGSIRYLRNEEGEPYYTNAREATKDFSFDMAPLNRRKFRSEYTTNYEGAKDVYGYGKVKWDYSAVQPTETSEENIQGGLSTREPFNLNALWGGTQYSTGRVSDFSHIDSTQLEANKRASEVRDELWNVYYQMADQGKVPEKTPDEVALDFYVKNVGQEGNQYGYGPGANSALISEAIKQQFLNSPDVVEFTGSTYQTSPEKIAEIDDFGVAHKAGVSTWQTFEQQGYSRDWFGDLLPMVFSALAFGPLAGALGGGALGAAGAGAILGGTQAEMSGKNFLEGALTGGIGGGLAGGLSGISSEVASALDVSQPVADAITRSAVSAVKTGISGGNIEDIEDAIIGSLVNSGVGIGVSDVISGSDISPDLVKTISDIATPVISTVVQGGDLDSALTNAIIKGGLSTLKDASWGVNQQDGVYAGDFDSTSYNDVYTPDISDSYSGLGYTPEEIFQLEQGTYAGPEQTVAETMEQMGDLYDLAYPEDFQSKFDTLSDAQKDQALALTQQGVDLNDAINQVQTSLSAEISDLQATVEQYKQLGYDQNTALQLAMDDLGSRMDLTSEQIGDISSQFSGDIQDLYDFIGVETSDLQSQFDSLSQSQKDYAIALHDQGVSLEDAINQVQTGLSDDILGLGGQISDINQQVSGLGGQVSAVQAAQKAAADAQAAKNYQNAMSALANIGSSSQSGGIGIKGTLAPQMLGSKAPENKAQVADYGAIIPKLASVLGQRGYPMMAKSGGSVNEPAEYVSGPEGKLYARHPVRGFAVGGPGTGQSDDIPTMLSDGEYVIDADTVAALGDGSSKAGADILDKFRQEIRKHKRSAPADKIPPKAKNPLAYLKSAKKSKG